MKLNWDIVRDVLGEVEDLPASQQQQFTYVAVWRDEGESAVKARHAFLLRDGGFLKGVDADTMESQTLLAPELTWAGHELLATIRSKVVWERVKAMAKTKGLALTFELVKIGGKMALEQVMRGGGDTDSAP
ncbi:DUF2513 domain-containing protein [Xylophilus sp. GOD-11R]|uniref:DUF2513 domain-containing protein n=1 Tax=Xylophilus sp. GOD-11R TaxID=3089814 RepID=UPI00298BD6BB|nr:DUF2513 domain-containing protein [Xylophilus sp. GOD-11R]WPB58725.1 DUF2513 domain-containing protein [Xylophilus sp. GOD-11R]